MNVLYQIPGEELDEIRQSIRVDIAQKINDLFNGCDNGEVLATCAAFLGFAIENLFEDNESRRTEALLYMAFVLALVDHEAKETSH